MGSDISQVQKQKITKMAQDRSITEFRKTFSFEIGVMPNVNTKPLIDFRITKALSNTIIPEGKKLLSNTLSQYEEIIMKVVELFKPILQDVLVVSFFGIAGLFVAVLLDLNFNAKQDPKVELLKDINKIVSDGFQEYVELKATAEFETILTRLYCEKHLTMKQKDELIDEGTYALLRHSKTLKLIYDKKESITCSNFKAYTTIVCLHILLYQTKYMLSINEPIRVALGETINNYAEQFYMEIETLIPKLKRYVVSQCGYCNRRYSISTGDFCSCQFCFKELNITLNFSGYCAAVGIEPDNEKSLEYYGKELIWSVIQKHIERDILDPLKANTGPTSFLSQYQGAPNKENNIEKVIASILCESQTVQNVY